MFIGHNAVAFASKKVAPRTNLGALMFAVMFLDLLWPILLLAGVEHVAIRLGTTRFTPLDFIDYPWSHSLLMSVVWSVLIGGFYWAFTRYGRGAVMMGIGVFSHWVLDFIVHRPDLPLWPHGPKVGLGLWNYPTATVTIEYLMLAAGVLIYRDATRPRDRIGSIGMWTFIGVLVAMFIVNASGPPPPNPRFLAWLGLGAWLIPLWAWWFDRHREPVAAAGTPAATA